MNHTVTSRDNSVGIVEKQYYSFAEPPDILTLESGAHLGPVTIAYETYGTLNEQKDNCILLTHAFSGDSHAAGFYAIFAVGLAFTL